MGVIGTRNVSHVSSDMIKGTRGGAMSTNLAADSDPGPLVTITVRVSGMGNSKSPWNSVQNVWQLRHPEERNATNVLPRPWTRLML